MYTHVARYIKCDLAVNVYGPEASCSENFKGSIKRLNIKMQKHNDIYMIDVMYLLCAVVVATQFTVKYIKNFQVRMHNPYLYVLHTVLCLIILQLLVN